MPDRPYTIVSCAVSIDGYLDDSSPDRLVLSGPEDLDEVDGLRAQADAILVGAGTIRADNPRLLVRDPSRVAAREARGLPPHPLRVTLTATGVLDPAARFFTGPGTPLVYAAPAAAAAAGKNLKDKAVVIAAVPELSLAAVLADLHAERTVATVLIEGGSRLVRDALAADLADELRLAVAPFFVGDQSAPRFAAPASYPHTPGSPMSLISVRQLGQTAVLRYRLTGTPGTSGTSGTSRTSGTSGTFPRKGNLAGSRFPVGSAPVTFGRGEDNGSRGRDRTPSTASAPAISASPRQNSVPSRSMPRMAS